jgi:hypothetical protein
MATLMGACLMMSTAGSAEVSAPAPPSGVKIKKVLPHWLDKQGRHLLSPSLLERDAYQALLRKEPERRGGLRFDVQCGTLPPGTSFVLKLEIRGSKSNAPTFVHVEQPLPPKARFQRWQSLTLGAEQYQDLGELVAWRATLWTTNQFVAEQKSFLW